MNFEIIVPPQFHITLSVQCDIHGLLVGLLDTSSRHVSP